MRIEWKVLSLYDEGSGARADESCRESDRASESARAATHRPKSA